MFRNNMHTTSLAQYNSLNIFTSTLKIPFSIQTFLRFTAYIGEIKK